MPAPRISHNPSRKYTPWRVLFCGKSYWFKTQAEAVKKRSELDLGKGKLTPREIDDYLYCKSLLEGVPLLRAVRFYNEHNSASLVNRTKTVAELVEACQAKLRGRAKYLLEGKRNLGLLSKQCGRLCVGEVSTHTIERYLDSFTSDWSYDSALKWARYFFKWCCSPLIKARPDNPCDGFAFRRPQGSKIYLTLSDVAHLMQTCRREFSSILPAVALQLFAGIRSEEIIRMEWRSIRRGVIRIEPEVGKMGQVKGKHVARIIDWWPLALETAMPSVLPTQGALVADFRRLKCALIRRCKETKPGFRWGQNAFRHSYGTYGLAFQQSSERICALMGERDVDTLHNHYAEYETQDNGQKYFSSGSSGTEPLPISHSTMKMLQNLLQTMAPDSAKHRGASDSTAA